MHCAQAVDIVVSLFLWKVIARTRSKDVAVVSAGERIGGGDDVEVSQVGRD